MQNKAFDEMRSSHAALEAEARGAVEKVAVYSRQAELADESLADAKEQLSALSKAHELVKTSESRAKAAHKAERAEMVARVEVAEETAATAKADLESAVAASNELALGLDTSRQRVQALEEEMVALLAQVRDQIRIYVILFCFFCSRA